MKRPNLVATVFAFCLGAGAAQATGLIAPNEPSGEPATPLLGQPTAPPQAPEGSYNPTLSLAPLVKALQPAVVNIHVEQNVRNEMSSMFEFFAPFMVPPEARQGDGSDFRVQTGQGSGFLISPDGYLLTNHHVVADADSVKVKLADDREFEGTVVGTDSRIDIALIKIDAENALPYVASGTSNEMSVGDWVVAIGNPFGLSHTVTAGIISAKGRVIGAGPYDNFIQTDASINPGNSGGPLFNLAGEVIGINTAINASGQGIGFAVPMDMVSPFLNDLKTDGEIARGWLGVSLQNLDKDLASGLNLGISSGVLLSEVHVDQPADKAGLQPGDLIQSVDGAEVDNSADLVRLIGRHRAGDKVKIGVIRNGNERVVSAKLGKRPSEKEIRTARFESNSIDRGPDKSPILNKLGFAVEPMPGGGARVTDVTSDTPAAGKLRSGDIIIEVNGTPVRQLSDLIKALVRRGQHNVMVVKRDGRQIYVALPKP